MLAAGIVVGTPPAGAELCTIDAVPAATLLVPYFAVDLGDGGVAPKNGIDTIFSITNTQSRDTTAQVRLFTDQGLGAIEFPVSLPGHGVVTISLSDVFNGKLPPGAADCLLPRDMALPAEGLSLGRLRRLAVAEGYILIDSVNDPCWDGSGEYFISGGTGVASNRNELSGEYYYSQKKFLGAARMIAIEAGNAPSVTTPGNATFYGSQFGFDARDNRERLGTVWGARFDTTGRSSAYLQVWQDPASAEMAARSIEFFDEDGSRTALRPTGLAALASQEVRIGKSQLPTGKTRGWLRLDFGDHQAAVIVRQGFKKRRSVFPADQQGGSTCRIAATSSTKRRRLGSTVAPKFSPPSPVHSVPPRSRPKSDPLPASTDRQLGGRKLTATIPLN